MVEATEIREDQEEEVELESVLARLRDGFERDRNPSVAARIANLDALEGALIRRKEDIASAISADYGTRSRHQSTLVEVFMTVEGIRYAKKELPKWVKREKRRTSLTFLPAKVTRTPQPKGVVGIISPWNYPVNLALGPMTGALSAGNRVMLKPSELTPKTSELLQSLLADIYRDDLVATVTGDASVGARFSGLAFDHLVFTGSTRVGKLVMKAAAENLTPVTLELGGKSPTIVHESYSLEEASKAIAVAKWFNAGQTCIAPDYVLASENDVDALARQLVQRVHAHYPRLRDNGDYTSIVSAPHAARMRALIEDARARGAKVIEVNPHGESFEGTNKVPPTILLDVTDEMDVMQEEIFGPILPIVPYRRLDDAIRYVNDRPRPLALYYFDDDRRRVERVLEQTVSGGAAINGCVWHFAQEDLPFGGVGPSGMGAYHAREGFETFSHMKSVFHQARFNGSALLEPPYGAAVETLLKVLLRG